MLETLKMLIAAVAAMGAVMRYIGTYMIYILLEFDVCTRSFFKVVFS